MAPTLAVSFFLRLHFHYKSKGRCIYSCALRKPFFKFMHSCSYLNLIRFIKNNKTQSPETSPQAEVAQVRPQGSTSSVLAAARPPLASCCPTILPRGPQGGLWEKDEASKTACTGLTVFIHPGREGWMVFPMCYRM